MEQNLILFLVNLIFPKIFARSVVVGHIRLTYYVFFILIKLSVGAGFSGKELYFKLVGHPYSILQMCPLINLANFILKECRVLMCLESCFRNFLP